LVLPGRFSAVVFDMDGLLVDSERSWGEAEAELFARHGAPYDPADIEDTHGRSVEETVALYEARLGAPAARLFDELIDLMRIRYATVVPARPGARELVAALRGRVGLAVASNSPRDLVELGLVRHGVRDAFEVIVTAAEVGRPKPAPDIYVEACRRLGVGPSDAVALEDSPPGIAAAKAAGLLCVGVPERATVDLASAGADVVVGSLLDLLG
jgi:HAD superfamily hydrolase (TIGR01509 family)